MTRLPLIRPPVARTVPATPIACVRGLLAAALLAAGLPLAHADGGDAPSVTDAAKPADPVPLWELGVVGIAAWQPAYPGAGRDIARARLLPYGVYRGSNLRIDDGGVGVRTESAPRFEWDVSAAAAFGSSSDQVPARAGMPSIGTLVEVGPELQANIGDLVHRGRDARATRLEIPIRAVFDVSDSFAHKGWTFEPRISDTVWTGGSASIVVNASTLFADRSLNQLYYGVDAPYATAGRPEYGARAGLVATRLGVSLRHRISSTLRLLYFANVETVRGAANESSPLVRSRQDAGLGISLIWGVFHSSETGSE